MREDKDEENKGKEKAGGSEEKEGNRKSDRR